MFYLFKSVAARTFRLGLMGILAVGVSIGAIHLALPFADLFRSELEDRLAEALGMEVRVGRLELGLAGLVPRLRLRDAVFLDPENGCPRLSLAQLRIDLDPVASLGALAPRVASVTLVGARLVVRRLPTGAIVVTGLEGLTGDDPAALGFFLGHGRFRLVDSELSWIDEQLGAPPLQLSEVRLDFENRGGGSRFLDLAAVRDLLTPLPGFLPEALDQLAVIHPGGGLHDLRFRFVHRSGLPLRWAVSARMEDSSLDAHGHVPSVWGLTAELAATERAGRLVFSGADPSLALPRLLPHPLGFDAAARGWRESFSRPANGVPRSGVRQGPRLSPVADTQGETDRLVRTCLCGR